MPVNNVLANDNNEPTERVIPLIDRPLDGFKEQPSGEINQYYVSQGFPNNGSLKKNYDTSYEAANRQPHERLFTCIFTYPFTVITLCCWKVG